MFVGGARRVRRLISLLPADKRADLNIFGFVAHNTILQGSDILDQRDLIAIFIAISYWLAGFVICNFASDRLSCYFLTSLIYPLNN